MKRVRLAAMILIAVIIIVTGVWWFVNSASSQTSTDILTSGFIEGKDVAIALEAGGRITEIAAEEGDRVEAGVTLVKLDDSLLKAQKQQAEANVQLAEASLAQAAASQDGAKKSWEDALDVLNNPLELQARIIAAEGEVDAAERSLRYTGLTPYQVRVDIAKKALENMLAIREHPQELIAKVDEAYSNYQIAVAQVEIANRQVEQAKAALGVIEVQLSQLTVSSPVSGVVATRNAEVGEIAQPGTSILTITELDKVTLTAYVPESKIGLVKLGQKALVSVDSYPDDSFSGEVIYIAPEAQFTPKNVQLKEEREKTVFAVKIRLDNPAQKLKPGMPADARIVTDSEG